MLRKVCTALTHWGVARNPILGASIRDLVLHRDKQVPVRVFGILYDQKKCIGTMGADKSVGAGFIKGSCIYVLSPVP